MKRIALLLLAGLAVLLLALAFMPTAGAYLAAHRVGGEHVVTAIVLVLIVVFFAARWFEARRELRRRAAAEANIARLRALVAECRRALHAPKDAA